MPLDSRSTPISGVAAEACAIPLIVQAETAGLTLRCAENGGWQARCVLIYDALATGRSGICANSSRWFQINSARRREHPS